MGEIERNFGTGPKSVRGRVISVEPGPEKTRILVLEDGRPRPAIVTLETSGDIPSVGEVARFGGRWLRLASGFEFSAKASESASLAGELRASVSAATPLPGVPDVWTGTAADGECFTFFFSERSPFSQWNRSASFSVPLPVDLLPSGASSAEWRDRFGDELVMNCGERSMMFHKAALFGDVETAARILAATEPRTQKALGRDVSPFDEGRWAGAAKEIVLRGNRARYRSNPRLATLLANTAGTTLVEASPYDRIWGIGVSATDPRALDRRSWLGANGLGAALTELRDAEFSLGSRARSSVSSPACDRSAFSRDDDR
jgi:ribA/ribD-fused uncharacterized protein